MADACQRAACRAAFLRAIPYLRSMTSMVRPRLAPLLAALLLGWSTAMAQQAQDGGQPATAAADTLVDQLARGDFAGAAARFDERMRAALPETKLRAAWEQIVGQAGAYRRRGESHAESAGALRVGVVPAEFERATLDVRVTLDDEGRVAGLFFAPHAASAAGQSGAADVPPYADPARYTEREVTVGEGEWALPATLTMPRGVTAAPAVVLVHGSGPNDRDETVGGVRPFRDLALGLASRGIAVLRYEKRTRAHGAAVMAIPRLTVRDEVTDDALAAVRLLRATPGIDPARVHVLGHSLGGMLAPRIALEDRDVAGLVIMAGSTRPLEDAILAQADYLASIGAATPEQLAPLREGVARIKSLTPADSARPDPIIGAPASYWLDLRSYNPAATAHALARPMLILQGGRDYQVTGEDFALWRAALEGRSDVELRELPALNHLFVAGAGKSGPAEYAAAAHVAPEVIEEIARWINARGAPRP
jgi:dienelactone hydrolase